MFADCHPSVPSPIQIGDKWTAKIIRCLESGPRRFSELQVPLGAVTPKVLTETLRAMQRDGLVTRTSYPEAPPRVEYELTSLGRSLREPLAAGCEWAQANLAALADARAEYEERTAGA
jgi:DNA-binding HxlR family transcriptional regulator